MDRNHSNGHQAPAVVTSTFFPCRQNKWEAKLWAEYTTKTKGDVYSRGMFYVGHDSPDKAATFLFSHKTTLVVRVHVCQCVEGHRHFLPDSNHVPQTCLPTSPALALLCPMTHSSSSPSSQPSTVVRLWRETSPYFMKVFINDMTT